jgi:hypothetical protein
LANALTTASALWKSAAVLKERINWTLSALAAKLKQDINNKSTLNPADLMRLQPSRHNAFWRS